MLPNAITLRNYRSFAHPVRLDLRPVTLLFGINNAGKSALLRALPLLGDSVGRESPGPLNLDSRAAFGSGFHDLRWKGLGEDDDPDLGITLHWREGEGPSEIEFSLTWFDEWRRLVVRRLSIRDGGGDLLEAEWVRRREERSAFRLSYELRTAEGASVHGIGFRGLEPESDAPGPEELLEPARRRLRGLHERVQWLGATRRLPTARVSAYPPSPLRRLRPDGEDVGAVLATQGEILEEVSGWYQRHLGCRLEVREVPPGSYRLVLRGLERAAFDVDLLDTGEGLIQVLPVLTALALGRHVDGAPSIVALEEPESHLHPELQRALAERICSTAAVSPRPFVVLETHSEHLLLGVQLQIVRQRLDPEDVLVYWVRRLENGESVVDRVTFDGDARPQGISLPPGVFTQDTEVAREIVRARLERSES